MDIQQALNSHLHAYGFCPAHMLGNATRWTYVLHWNLCGNVLTQIRADPTNTNVYIGNVPPEMNETDIRRHFQTFGPVVDVKLHKKGGYGFVRFQVGLIIGHSHRQNKVY